MNDIGESMAASWLRHVEKCKIVTTNWTVDIEEKYSFHEKFVQLLNIGRQVFSKKGIEIFPNKELSSIIKQAECDVVGFQFQSGSISKLYGIDVAVHSKGKGLDYGDNIKKIIEKSLRTALCFYTILGVKKNCPIEIYFLTPKMDKNEKTAAEEALKCLKGTFKGFKIKFILYANKSFYEEILEKLNNKNHLDASDTNEQFMRSLVIMDMCKKYVKQKSQEERKEEEEAEKKEIQIGQLAQTELRTTLESIDVSIKSNSNLISRLQTIEGTKAYFEHLGNLALLVKDRSDNFARRYYSKPLVIGKEVYYMCNNWLTGDKENLQKFIDDRSQVSTK